MATDLHPPSERPTVFRAPGIPDRERERFALDADVTVYWPWVRPCWEERHAEKSFSEKEYRPQRILDRVADIGARQAHTDPQGSNHVPS